MLAPASTRGGGEAASFSHYRSLITLMALAIIGSLIASIWLLPSRLERVAVAVEQGAPSLIRQELDRATNKAANPGEVRALVDVALTIGSPELAASILDRFLESHADSVDALRLLVEVQRQRHLMRDVAALDERLYALSGDVEALRDAADIYASRRMAPERVGALRRLVAVDRASGSDIAELTHRLSGSGETDAAFTLLTDWLSVSRDQPPSAELIGLAASLSADRPDAQTTALKLGDLIGRSGQLGLLHVLIQTYAERRHPALSLVAGYALGDEMTARPDVGLVLAQLEALQGKFEAARGRLDAMARDGKLLPAGLPMLAELMLQAGDLPRAVSIAASLAPDQIAEGFPHRLVEAVYAAGRTDLLAHLAVDQIAASSPASAASIALAGGDRARAVMLARLAVNAGGDTADFGPAFGHVVQSLGLEREAIARLVVMARNHPLEEEPLSLLIQLAESRRSEWPSLLEALLRQRDTSPRAGVVWSTLAARHGQSPAVITWLKSAAARLPAQALIDLLVLGVDRRDTTLARSAAAALTDRVDLPAGWTQGEITLTLQSNEPLDAARLRKALDLIGGAEVSPAARDRITAFLVGAPQFAQQAQLARIDAHDPAFERVAAAVTAGGSPAMDQARLILLTTMVPRQTLPLLTARLSTDRVRLMPLYLAALLRTGQVGEAQAELTSFLRGLPPAQREAKLHETLGYLAAGEALPVFRVAVTMVAGADWVAAYDDALVKAGLIDELRASLRSRAAAAGGDMKQLQAIASRLLELKDRMGAIAVMLAAAAEKPPGSTEVEQLMYLWGPRASPDAITWTMDRARKAPLAEVPKWMEHLAYLGDPNAVISSAERRSAIFAQSAAAVRSYDAAIVAANIRAAPDLWPAVASASSSDQLVALAQLALDTKQPALAWHAARTAVAASPSSKEGLWLAAQAASTLRRSDDAAALYVRLLAIGPQSPEVYVDAGDALMTAKRAKDGRRVLESALAQLPPEPSTLATARLRARALTLLGRTGEADGLLAAWFARFPDHAGLKADMLQLDLLRRADQQGDRD